MVFAEVTLIFYKTVRYCKQIAHQHLSRSNDVSICSRVVKNFWPLRPTPESGSVGSCKDLVAVCGCCVVPSGHV